MDVFSFSFSLFSITQRASYHLFWKTNKKWINLTANIHRLEKDFERRKYNKNIKKYHWKRKQLLITKVNFVVSKIQILAGSLKIVVCLFHARANHSPSTLPLPLPPLIYILLLLILLLFSLFLQTCSTSVLLWISALEKFYLILLLPKNYYGLLSPQLLLCFWWVSSLHEEIRVCTLLMYIYYNMSEFVPYFFKLL